MLGSPFLVPVLKMPNFGGLEVTNFPYVSTVQYQYPVLSHIKYPCYFKPFLKLDPYETNDKKHFFKLDPYENNDFLIVGIFPLFGWVISIHQVMCGDVYEV